MISRSGDWVVQITALAFHLRASASPFFPSLSLSLSLYPSLFFPLSLFLFSPVRGRCISDPVDQQKINSFDREISIGPREDPGWKLELAYSAPVATYLLLPAVDSLRVRVCSSRLLKYYTPCTHQSRRGA